MANNPVWQCFLTWISSQCCVFYFYYCVFYFTIMWAHNKGVRRLDNHNVLPSQDTRSENIKCQGRLITKCLAEHPEHPYVDYCAPTWTTFLPSIVEMTVLVMPMRWMLAVSAFTRSGLTSLQYSTPLFFIIAAEEDTAKLGSESRIHKICLRCVVRETLDIQWCEWLCHWQRRTKETSRKECEKHRILSSVNGLSYGVGAQYNFI